MSNWAQEAFAPYEAYMRELVKQDTWGHLAPQKNTSYSYRILFAHSEYGATGDAIIDSRFCGLDDSPWLFQAMNDFIDSFKIKEPGVYIVEGRMRNYRFWGTPKLIATINHKTAECS